MNNTINMQTVISELKRLRTKAKLTRKEVAEQVEIAEATIADYESGKIRLTAEAMIKLAKFYKVSLDDLAQLTHKNEITIDIAAKRLAPLFCLGLSRKEWFMVNNTILHDYYIQKELNIQPEQLQKRVPIFEKLLQSLTSRERHQYSLELLKYVNSIIGIDGIRTSQEEIVLASIKQGFEKELNAKELKDIASAGRNKYFGNVINHSFGPKHYKRLIIWVLMFVAYVDNQVAPEEEQYIKEVIQHLFLKEELYYNIRTQLDKI